MECILPPGVNFNAQHNYSKLYKALITCCERNEGHLYFPDGLLNLKSLDNRKLFESNRISPDQFIKNFMSNYKWEYLTSTAKFRPPASWHADCMFDLINQIYSGKCNLIPIDKLLPLFNKVASNKKNHYLEDNGEQIEASRYFGEEHIELPKFNYISFFNALEFLPLEEAKSILFLIVKYELEQNKIHGKLISSNVATCLAGGDNMYIGDVNIYVLTYFDILSAVDIDYTKEILDELGPTFQLNYY